MWRLRPGGCYGEQVQYNLSSHHLADTSPVLPDLLTFRKEKAAIQIFMNIIPIQVLENDVWGQQSIYGPVLSPVLTVWNFWDISMIFACGQVVIPIQRSDILVALYPNLMISW